MSCPHGEWHSEDCEVCQKEDELYARIARLEADVLRSDKAVEDAAVALEVCDVALATEREHPTSVLQCAACQRLAVVQNVELAARAELAEAEIADLQWKLGEKGLV